MTTLDVAFLPDHLAPADLANRSAVVIDLLRASTTIVHALAHGANAVMACETISAAHDARKQNASEKTLLGGERGGVKIDGFDLGNSPRDYSRERITDHTIILTTTNGTRALWKCADAAAVYIGCFANLTAVANRLVQDGRDIILVCAGTDRQITREDVLCAGGIADLCQSLIAATQKVLHLTDAAALAKDSYQAASSTNEFLIAAVANSQGGRNLMELGYSTDIEFCAKRNSFSVVPVFNKVNGRIVND